MLFVPLPLFATLFLAYLLVRFVLTRDMRMTAHRFFAALIALYGLQSLLVTLRWGYEIDAVAPLSAWLAPVLPVLAFCAYRALTTQRITHLFWPFAAVALNWAVYAIDAYLADPVILLTYLGFGGALLWQATQGADRLSLTSLNNTADVLRAMVITGGALVASGLTDVFVIYDFVTNEGRNLPIVVTFVQTGFVLLIGAAAVFGKTAESPEEVAPPAPPAATEEDADIIARLDVLFTRDRLHLSEDLSVRRLSRKLGLSDRQVSNAVNRVKDMSVSQYVNTFRIAAACDQLRDTDETVMAVSLASGFATKSNFNREFLRITGHTPTQWRAAFRA